MPRFLQKLALRAGAAPAATLRPAPPMPAPMGDVADPFEAMVPSPPAAAAADAARPQVTPPAERVAPEPITPAVPPRRPPPLATVSEDRPAGRHDVLLPPQPAAPPAVEAEPPATPLAAPRTHRPDVAPIVHETTRTIEREARLEVQRSPPVREPVATPPPAATPTPLPAPVDDDRIEANVLARLAPRLDAWLRDQPADAAPATEVAPARLDPAPWSAPPPARRETEEPRLVIGRIRVDVVPTPAAAPAREAPRVVRRVASPAPGRSAAATRLSFGLEQV